MQDELLIKRAQAGDESAFAELIDQHYALIYRFAFKWCGKQTDAEDICQQACVKLARNIKQYQFNAAFSSWLYRLVINCAKDWTKAETRHQHEDVTHTEESVDTTASNTTSNEVSHYLQQVLTFIGGMAAGYKETALLVFAEGFSHKETAEILGEKEKTISWRIHEIRKQLQQFVQQELAP